MNGNGFISPNGGGMPQQGQQPMIAPNGIGTNDRKQFINIILASIAKIQGMHFNDAKTRPIAQQFEKYAFANSINKQQYVNFLKSKIAGITQARKNAIQRQRQKQQQQQVQQQQVQQQAQQQQAQQVQQAQQAQISPQQGKFAPGMMQSAQNQYASQFASGNSNQQMMQQAQAQVQHLKIDMQTMAIPQPLLQRLPQVFPKNMNSWGQIMPYFRHSKLTQKDLTTIKQVYAVHLQLVRNKQQQQRQRIQQQSVQAGRGVGNGGNGNGNVNNAGVSNNGINNNDINNNAINNAGVNNAAINNTGINNNAINNNNISSNVPSPQQILMMQGRAQNGQNSTLQNTNGMNSAPRSNQQQNIPAITAQQLQVYKQQAVQAIKNLQAAGKLPATLTREQGNMYARKYLFHVLSLKQRKLNGQLGAMNAVPAAPQRVSQFQQQRKQRAEAQARQRGSVGASNAGSQGNSGNSGNMGVNMNMNNMNNMNLGNVNMGNVNMGNASNVNKVNNVSNLNNLNNLTSPDNSGRTQFAGQLPTNQNQARQLGPGVGSNAAVRGLGSGNSGAGMSGVSQGPGLASAQKTADGRTILTPRLFNGIRATQDDWKRLKAIYRETASSPINLKDVTDSLTNTEKQQIIRLVRQLQQLMIITETVIIPNFYMLTRSYDGTKKLIYSELMIKQVLEKLKAGGRFYANLDLLTRIQNQITRFLGYIKEQNTKLVRMQRQQPRAQAQVGLGMPNSAVGTRVSPAVVSQQFKELAEQRHQPADEGDGLNQNQNLNLSQGQNLNQNLNQHMNANQGQAQNQNLGANQNLNLGQNQNSNLNPSLNLNQNLNPNLNQNLTLAQNHPSVAQQRRRQQFTAHSLQPQYLNQGAASPLSAGTPMAATPLGSSPGALGAMGIASPAAATPPTRRRRKPRARKGAAGAAGAAGSAQGPPAAAAAAASAEAQALMKENAEHVAAVGARAVAADKERARRRRLAAHDAGRYLLATLADSLNLPEQERRVEQEKKGGSANANSANGNPNSVSNPSNTKTKSADSASPGSSILTPSAVLATPLAFNVKTPLPARLYDTPKMGATGALAVAALGAAAGRSHWTGKVRSACVSGAFEGIVGDVPRDLERKRLVGKDLIGLVYPTPPDDDASATSKRRKLSGSEVGNALATPTPLKSEGDAPDLRLDLDKFWDFDRV